jgi:hypothetical protein
MKKMIAFLVVGTLVIAQTAFAEDVTVKNEEPIFVYSGESKSGEEVTVDPELIGFVDVFHEVAVELTDSEKDKLLLLVEFISQKNERIQVLLQAEQYEKATRMLEQYNFDVNRVQELLETSVTGEVVEEDLIVFEEIEETFAEKTSMQGVNLQNLLEKGDLPAPALAGIQKALGNQERAQEKRQQAQERKEQRKALKEEMKEQKQQEKVTEEGKTVKAEKNEKAQKNQEKAAKQAKKGKEKAAKAAEKGKEIAEKAKQKGQGQGPGNKGKND